MTSLSGKAASSFPTGELDGANTTDSVNIAYSDLRIVNSKLIELEYTKEANKKLQNVVRNDSIIIQGLDRNLKVQNETHEATVKQLKRERNIFAGCGIGVTLLFIITMFCK